MALASRHVGLSFAGTYLARCLAQSVSPTPTCYEIECVDAGCAGYSAAMTEFVTDAVLTVTDADEAEWWAQPADLRALRSLEHMMIQLADLPRWACDTSPLAPSTLTFTAYIACVDSYFTSARLAAEFFWKLPPQDITARTFVPGWQVPAGIGARMERVWVLASKHVLHMSRDSVPAVQPADWQKEDTSYGALMRTTRDAFRALALFSQEYAATGGAHAQYLHDMHRDLRPRTQKGSSVRAWRAAYADVGGRSPLCHDQAMEIAWPKTFRVGVTTPGLWRGNGDLVVALGFLACSPGPLTGALGRAGEVVHDGRHVDLFVARLVPPWFNVTIPVRGQAGVIVASTWILAKHKLRRTLQAAASK